MIKFDNVTKNFNGFTAVKNLDLEIPEGEFFGFLGPNGAGKTTTIKMLTGLLKPSKGTVTIDGVNIQDKPELVKSWFGYIPDSPYLYDKLSGREFLYFIANLYGMEKEDAEKRISWLLELFEMDILADKRVEEYSHGMRQKIVMSAAFLHRPKIIIVDEPMVGLDPQSAKIVKTILRKLCDEHKTTVFMSTHTLIVAEELCDRIGIILEGELIAIGTLEELRQLARSERGMSLEDLFLELTGGVKEAEIMK